MQFLSIKQLFALHRDNAHAFVNKEKAFGGLNIQENIIR